MLPFRLKKAQSANQECHIQQQNAEKRSAWKHVHRDPRVRRAAKVEIEYLGFQPSTPPRV
jgi:hypothetical protein